MEILKSVEALYEKMVERRRHIHENPELSTMEDQTCEYIVEQLTEAGFDEVVNIPNGGVIAWVRGGKKGKTVMLRADIDALPLQESPCNLSKERTCISKVDIIALIPTLNCRNSQCDFLFVLQAFCGGGFCHHFRHQRHGEGNHPDAHQAGHPG